MRLYTSPTSPYGRVTRIVVGEKGSPPACEVVFTDPWDPNAKGADSNPLGKVPVLVLDDSGVVVDSRVIAEYLDEALGGPPLMPHDARERWRVRSTAAIAAGAIDMGVMLVLPLRVDKAIGTPKLQEYCGKKILSACAHLDGLAGAAGFLHGDSFTLADATAAALLGFLDFRQPGIDWRGAAPALAGWFERVSGRQSVSSTVPAQ